MLLSIGLLLVNLSFYLDDLMGATLALYLLPLAGAESAIALALLVAFYPTRLNLNYSRFAIYQGSRYCHLRHLLLLITFCYW